MRDILMKIKDKIKVTATLGRELTGEEKISVAREEVSSAFYQFEEIDIKLVKVNESLRSVIKEEEQKLKMAKNNIQNAQDELTMNQALQKKLEQFIV